MKNDIIGEKFGRLTVKKIDKDKKRYYICQCECGKIKSIYLSHLKSGATRSCGCYNKEKTRETNLINLVGRKYRRITITSFKEIRNKKTYWNYICKCGKTGVVSSSSFVEKNVKSCGCLKKEKATKTHLINLKNKAFGNLKVIKQYGKDKRNKINWLCQCSCGNRKVISGQTLRRGLVKSCGCLNESWIANSVKKYLNKKWKCVFEYKILKNPDTNRYLPYDIFIPDINFFIEINGKQHYIFEKHFYKTEEDFNYRKYKDRLKRKFARKNGTYVEIDLRKIKTKEEAIRYIEGFLI